MTRSLKPAFLAVTTLVLGACATATPTNTPQEATPDTAEETEMSTVPTKATLIHITANDSRSEELRSFLTAGRDLVVSTEPGTLQWHALVQEEKIASQAIFDTFADDDGRSAHFAGQVAAALHERADRLVSGGWEDGVLANVHHYEVLAVKAAAPKANTPSKATYITLKAKAGQAKQLERLLITARDVVADTEPGTLQWFALKLEGSDDEFAIYDTFADDAGRAAHFGGQVAAALKDAAETLIEGGWENGVLTNVVHYDLAAAK